MAHALRLVTDADEPQAHGQLALRPVAAFVREVVVKAAICRKRRKSVPRRLPAEQLDFIVVTRPRTYGECAELVVGPCPWVSCSHNLYLNVDPRSGRIRFAFPGKEVWELAETCALRVVDERGALSAAKVGRLTNLSDAAVLKIENSGRRKLVVLNGYGRIVP